MLTLLLGFSRWLRYRIARRHDVKHIRATLKEGEALVMNAKDVEHEENGCVVARSSASVWRALLYNSMIEKLRVVLELQQNLSVYEKHEIFEALNWFHTKGPKVKIVNGKLEPVWDLPTGRWPAKHDMTTEEAKEKFEKLRAIKWLKLKAA